jgi:hypothetical protein
MIRFGKNIRIAILNSLNNNTNGFGNAKMELYEGPKPERCWYPIHPKCTKILEVILPSAENNTITENGVLQFNNEIAIISKNALTNGDPNWFRITATNNDVIMDGTVGTTESFDGDDLLLYTGIVQGEKIYIQYWFYVDEYSYNYF